MRQKHRNDYKHVKGGRIGGNARYGKHNGNFKGERASDKFSQREALGLMEREKTEEINEQWDRDQQYMLDVEMGYYESDPYADCDCGLCSPATAARERAEYEAEYGPL